MVGRLPYELVFSSAGANRVVCDFDFLGAGIGSADHVEAHALARVQQTSALLDAIAVLPDPQVALRLLQHCSSTGSYYAMLSFFELQRGIDPL